MVDHKPGEIPSPLLSLRERTLAGNGNGLRPPPLGFPHHPPQGLLFLAGESKTVDETFFLQETASATRLILW
jgi:hypothetical protein